MTCKSGAQTQDGSKFSSTRTTNSSTGKTVRYLMSQEPRMLKDKQSKFLVTTVEKANSGMLSTLMK
jgi:hypothetical protein